MNRNRLLVPFLLTALLTACFIQSNTAIANELGVKEYDEFHDVLHPLEHEAMPKKDYQQIRTRAAELVGRGKAIVKLKVPATVRSENVEEFKKELAKFDAALKTFSKAAKKGTDDQVRDSFDAVHDSYEMLAGLLRRK